MRRNRALSVSPWLRCAVSAARVQNQADNPKVIAASAKKNGRAETFNCQIGVSIPANMSGKITLVSCGQTHIRTVVIPKGEPDNFLSEAELRAKFAGLTNAVLGEARAARLADAVLALPTTSDIAALTRLASPVMPARLAGE